MRVWWVTVVIAVAAACSGGSRVERCGLIPEGGCPIGRGGTCADLECAALYDCVDGAWTPVETCPPGEGGGGSGPGGAATSSGAGGCYGVSIDRTGEVVGCTPDLQLPDCPAAVAESCRPCDTGCIDFFLCKARGWETVAYCDQDGMVVLEP